MGNRKRINLASKLGEVIVDELAYTENKGSKNARKVIDKSESVHIEVWYDKHYINRQQFGNDDGTARKGIGEATIQDLVSDSFCHLMHYSFVVKGFAFINRKEQNDRTLRVVLQREREDSLLNVAVGFHHISGNKYEVTVFTAMVTDEFRVSDGQYVVLISDKNSELYKMDNKKLKFVETYPE